MFSGSISMASRLAFSGMVLKLTANTTSAGAAPEHFQDQQHAGKDRHGALGGAPGCSEARSEGRWVWVCMALLASYRPRQQKRSHEQEARAQGEQVLGRFWNSASSACPIAKKHRP